MTASNAFTIPQRFLSVLSGSTEEAEVKRFAAKVQVILHHNKMPFFPAYTDHGATHVEQVLATCDRLIPADVFSASLFTAQDAAVLINATLLHDLALHIDAPGFVSLVQRESAHKPVEWFAQPNGQGPPDRPWSELWHDYALEVRRMSSRKLEPIVGLKEATTDAPDLTDLAGRVSNLSLVERLLVGEFMRRHHARLAHEVALHGFPGLTPDDFPVLAQSVPALADLMGVVARSHWLSMRVACRYLDETYGGRAIRQRGAVAPYLMALLRVSDYLQIEKDRAPLILLRLTQPQSPVSVDEWKKHHAVVGVYWDTVNPASIDVEIGSDHTLSTHLQLKALLNSLLAELDLSSAFLAERYGRYEDEHYHRIRLAKTSVTSNLDDDALLRKLPYVAMDVGFSADPRLLTLLVEPLYGEQPNIGIRELVQNAVDSVRERLSYVSRRPQCASRLRYPAMNCDVRVDLCERSDGNGELCVIDKGLGMSPELVRDYFLKGGASFRNSPAWQAEFVDPVGEPRVVRSGRFGIGLYAAFLLGPEIVVTTRHVEAEEGINFHLHRDRATTELRRVPEANVGTTVAVRLERSTFNRLRRAAGRCRADTFVFEDAWDWYRLESPIVERRLCVSDKPPVALEPMSFTMDQQTSGVRFFDTPEFPHVVWYRDRLANPLLVNGLVVPRAPDEWNVNGADAFAVPRVNIEDPQAKVPLSLQRDRLLTQSYPAPLEKALLTDLGRDAIAYALAFAASGSTRHLQGPEAVPAYRLTRLQEGQILSELHPFVAPTGIGLGDPWVVRQAACDRLRLFVGDAARLLQRDARVSDCPTEIAFCTADADLGIRDPGALDHSLVVAKIAKRALSVEWERFRSHILRIRALVFEPFITLGGRKSEGICSVAIPETRIVANYVDTQATSATRRAALLFSKQFSFRGFDPSKVEGAIVDVWLDTSTPCPSPRSIIAQSWKRLIGTRVIPREINAQEELRREVFDREPKMLIYYTDWLKTFQTGSRATA